MLLRKVTAFCLLRQQWILRNPTKPKFGEWLLFTFHLNHITRSQAKQWSPYLNNLNKIVNGRLCSWVLGQLPSMPMHWLFKLNFHRCVHVTKNTDNINFQDTLAASIEPCCWYCGLLWSLYQCLKTTALYDTEYYRKSYLIKKCNHNCRK